MRTAIWPALCVCLGCASPAAGPVSPAPPQSEPIARADAADGEPPPVVPAPTSTTSNASADVSGTPPSWPTVLAAARELGLRKPTQAAAMAALGGGRWAAAIRTTDRSADEGGAWSTHVLVVDASTAPVRVLDRRMLATMEEAGLSEPERARVAVFADDYDGDGQRELLVRFGFSRMLCGIGEVSRRELRVYAVGSEGGLRPQVVLTLDDRNYRQGTTGRESFVDRTDDGRPDLVVATRGFVEDLGDGDGEAPAAPATVVYAYVPARDEYERPGGKGRAREASAIDFRIWDDCDDPDEGGQSPGSGAP